MNKELFDAFQVHQSGDLSRAEGLYRRLLEVPSIALQVNQLLGALLLQKKEPKSAIPHLEAAVLGAPTSLPILNNLAIAYTRSERKEEAVATYLRSLAVEPSNVETLKNLAEVLIKWKRYQAAVDVLSRAIPLNPTSGLLLMKYGLALYKLDRNQEAKVCFERILGREPNHFKALLGLGRVLLRHSVASAESVQVWQRLVEMSPTNPAILNNYGSVLKKNKQDKEAEEVLRRSLQFAPEFLPAICNLGIVLAAQGRYEESRDRFRQAIAMEANRSAEFESDLEGDGENYSLVDEPTWKKYGCIAYGQLATLENVLGNLAAAEIAIDRALSIDSEHAESHLILALLRLQHGDFEMGWREYEWRKRSTNAPRMFSEPEWRGENNPEHTVLIHAEQGLGDTLQFVRYAKIVKKRVGRVVVMTQRPLVQFIRGCLEVDDVVSETDPTPAFDSHIALMSLPTVLQTKFETIPSQVPYLVADPNLVAEWRIRFQPSAAIRVGIAWQGNKEFGFDRDRSVPLRYFKPLSQIAGVELISLQKGYGTEQLNDIDFNVTKFSGVDEMAGPFMDTAAMMMNLDLVIASCTATAHLAGGLGRPVWLAKSFNWDWRWRSDEHGANPWYPTMQMFAQRTRGDWGSVFERMADELRLMTEK